MSWFGLDQIPCSFSKQEYSCGPIHWTINRLTGWEEAGGEVLLKLENATDEYYIILKELGREPNIFEKQHILLKLNDGTQESYIMLVHKKK